MLLFDKPIFLNRSIQEWFISLPTIIILFIVIFISSSQYIHSQLLQKGEEIWGDYHVMRGIDAEMEIPSCEMDIESLVANEITRVNALPDEDEFGLPNDKPNPQAIRKSFEDQLTICEKKQNVIQTSIDKLTPTLKVYRTIEKSIAGISNIAVFIKRPLLIILLVLCAVSTTLHRHHISLRPIKTKLDYYVSQTSQLITALVLLYSSYKYFQSELTLKEQGVEVGNIYMQVLWIVSAILLIATNVWMLLRPSDYDLEDGGNIFSALLTIPLFSIMGNISALNFIAFMGFDTGVSVFIADIVGSAGDLLLSLALYIFIGMLLKESRIPQLALNIIRPWRMSSELLCFIVLLIAAVPTAYTGASGIFIIAAGAIIFEEVRMANTRGQLALATTAMSGSMGVVLKPCLLIVIIASLNDSVTTSELFTYGMYVFLLSAFLFFVFTQLTRQEPIRIAPVSEAFPKSLAALVPLLPYVFIAAAVVLIYGHVFDQTFDEYSAPVILPLVLVTILIYERVFSKNVSKAMDSELNTHYQKDNAEVDSHIESETTEQALRFATNETTNHIGALLFLMFFTAAIGGLIESSGIMHSFPTDLDNFWLMLGLLVATLVVVGMFMEPYGAVILVNAVFAPIAFANGINPLHFWLITLVAFELGYLSPPVALNHLLTRHVIGEEAAEIARNEPLPKNNFYFRYERFLLPIVVMGTSLLLVAFVPPLIGYEAIGFVTSD